MRPFRLFRTTSFRLTALYLGVFTLSVLVLGIVVYFSVGREIESELDERVRAELGALRDYGARNGLDRLAEEIRVRTGHAAPFDYRLEDAGGRLLVGALPLPKLRDGTYRDGWMQLSDPKIEPDADSDSDQVRALVATLVGGGALVVGQGLSGVDEARRAVLVAFAWALGATLVLGTVGGLVISAGFLHRIETMSRAAQGIMAGNLRQRIPSAGVDDDLSRLADTFNRMFDRIEKLIEANRHVSHDIAHDLRRPLARIVRRLESARSGPADALTYEEAVDGAIADVHGVLETFNALLRIAQIETGARRAGFMPVDLAALAREVAEAFQPAADDEGKSLTIDTPVAFPLSGDRELLTQLVANLVDNALRHTPVGTRIGVRTVWRADAAALEISDDGPGVPECQRGNIFERFHRLDAARTTPGDGLGLSLVAAIAELHGLKAVAEDNQPGLRIAVTWAKSSPSI